MFIEILRMKLDPSNAIFKLNISLKKSEIYFLIISFRRSEQEFSRSINCFHYSRFYLVLYYFYLLFYFYKIFNIYNISFFIFISRAHL